MVPSRTTPPFFLIRHGETDWNREGRLQGQRDIPLNPLGRDQAAGAGRALLRSLRVRDLAPAASRYIASPLRRARDTMERVRQAVGLDAAAYEIDARLQELSFGEWEGCTWPDVKALAPLPVRERKRDKWAFVPPGGESYAQLADRLRPWVETICTNDVVVAHGGVARALMYLVTGADRAQVPDADIRQGRVLVFESGRCHWE